MLDGITYQAVPMPSDSTYEIGKLANAGAYTSDTLDGSGHIRVTVSPDCIKVDYVRVYLPADTLSGQHHNGEVVFSYTIGNCPASSIQNSLRNESLSTFPNPANSKILVKLPDDAQEYQLTLYNNMGQQMLMSAYNEIDVSALTEGIYFLHAKTANKQYTKKIIIQHQ